LDAPSLREVYTLNSVENFSYNVVAGYLEWSFRNGQMKGVVPHLIDSKEFCELADRIISASPYSFLELVEYLGE
jgi:hypothetical protein